VLLCYFLLFFIFILFIFLINIFFTKQIIRTHAPKSANEMSSDDDLDVEFENRFEDVVNGEEEEVRGDVGKMVDEGMSGEAGSSDVALNSEGKEKKDPKTPKMKSESENEKEIHTQMNARKEFSESEIEIEIENENIQKNEECVVLPSPPSSRNASTHTHTGIHLHLNTTLTPHKSLSPPPTHQSPRNIIVSPLRTTLSPYHPTLSPRLICSPHHQTLTPHHLGLSPPHHPSLSPRRTSLNSQPSTHNARQDTQKEAAAEGKTRSHTHSPQSPLFTAAKYRFVGIVCEEDAESGTKCDLCTLSSISHCRTCDVNLCLHHLEAEHTSIILTKHIVAPALNYREYFNKWASGRVTLYSELLSQTEKLKNEKVEIEVLRTKNSQKRPPLRPFSCLDTAPLSNPTRLPRHSPALSPQRIPNGQAETKQNEFSKTSLGVRNARSPLSGSNRLKISNFRNPSPLIDFQRSNSSLPSIELSHTAQDPGGPRISLTTSLNALSLVTSSNLQEGFVRGFSPQYRADGSDIKGGRKIQIAVTSPNEKKETQKVEECEKTVGRVSIGVGRNRGSGLAKSVL
jgi:hypothetical protein